MAKGKPTSVLSKKKAAKKGGTGKLSGISGGKARSIGLRLSSVFSVKKTLPTVRYLKGMKPQVLRRLFVAGELKDDSAINRIYRATHGQQDELFSTALTREFIKGFFDSKGLDGYKADEQKYLTELIDLASSVRIPTEFSGFATKDGVMQHPANRSKAVFADPYDTASLHAKMDTERRDYVESAMQRTIDSGVTDVSTVMREGVKAAIEHTLNYFTAPVTADDVFSFSRSSGKNISDETLQNQLASREQMKVRYVELGGSLRDLAAPESQTDSWTRSWRNPRTLQDEAITIPPSPRRQPNVASTDIEMMELVL